MKRIIFALVALAITAGASFAEPTKLRFWNDSGAIIRVWTDNAGGGKEWTTANQNLVEWVRDGAFTVTVKPNWFGAYDETSYYIPEGEELVIQYTGSAFDLKVKSYFKDIRKVRP